MDINSRESVLGTLEGRIQGRVPWVEIETRDELIAKSLGKNEVDWSDRVRYACETGLDAVGIAHWDRFGCDVISKGEVLGFIPRIKDRTDMSQFRMPDKIDEEKLIENVRRANEAIGSSGLALFVSHLLCLDPVIMDLGFENFCIKIYTEPDFIAEMMERYTEYYSKLTSLYSRLPEIDFIWIGEDIAFNDNLYLRPNMFLEKVYPYFKRITENIKKPWIYHSDGNISAVFDEMLKLGMNAMHPFQPEAMDIRAFKKTHGNDVTLVGTVNLNTLGLGTPEEVEAEVLGLMNDLSPGGRYMLSSSNSLAAWVLPENVIAMGNAKKTWNRQHGYME